jgi:hypothetical protein
MFRGRCGKCGLEFQDERIGSLETRMVEHCKAEHGFSPTHMYFRANPDEAPAIRTLPSLNLTTEDVAMLRGMKISPD